MSGNRSGGEEEPPLGSVGDEATKLFEALQDWVKETGPGAAGMAGGRVDGLGEQWRLINEHVATGGTECTYCPVCQVIAKVRGTSPEVRTHLAVATSALLQAAALLVEARSPRARPEEPRVTRIDLDDGSPEQP